MEERGAPAYVAEFIGTFMLVLFIALAVSLTTKEALGFADFVLIGLVHAFALAVLVYAVGGTSGAHFNPAVTSTLLALRKIGPADALIYVLMQLAGAVAAVLVCKVLLLDEGAAANYGAATPSPLIDGKASAAFLCEIIGTFTLMWAIMGVAVNPRGERAIAGWVIGMALGLAVMCFAALDGASFNPARWFGPAVVSGTWTAAWAYIAGPIAGAALAGFVYKLIVLDPQHKEVDRPVDTLG